MKTPIAALLLCALAQAAGAQTVYKCSAGGKVSYGEQPCAHGKASQLAIPAAPAPAAVGAAREQLARERARLAAMQKERGAAQAREEREYLQAAKSTGAARQKCDRLRLHATWAQEDAARAGKAAAGARLKAQRQAQALAVECPG